MDTTTEVNVSKLETVFAVLRAKIKSGEISLKQLDWYSKLSPTERDNLDDATIVDDEVEKVQQAPTGILRCILDRPLTIPATDGTETILNAKDVFKGYIELSFRSLCSAEPIRSTLKTQVMVYEVVREANWAQMFSSLAMFDKKLWLTQGQVVSFARTHPEYLQTPYHLTFLLFQTNEKFFVAVLSLTGRGRIFMDVRRFHEDDREVWSAVTGHRVVVPQW